MVTVNGKPIEQPDPQPKVVDLESDNDRLREELEFYRNSRPQDKICPHTDEQLLDFAQPLSIDTLIDLLCNDNVYGQEASAIASVLQKRYTQLEEYNKLLVLGHDFQCNKRDGHKCDCGAETEIEKLRGSVKQRDELLQYAVNEIYGTSKLCEPGIVNTTLLKVRDELLAAIEAARKEGKHE